MGQLSRATTASALQVEAAAHHAQRMDPLFFGYADATTAEVEGALKNDKLLGQQSKQKLPQSSSSFKPSTRSSCNTKLINFSLAQLKSITQKLTHFTMNGSPLRQSLTTTAIATRVGLPAVTTPEHKALKGILKPYKGSKHQLRFGFSYNRPCQVMSTEYQQNRGGGVLGNDNNSSVRVGNVFPKRVSFGKELNVTVYHYMQVDVDDKALPSSPLTTSSSPFTLTRLVRGGRAVYPKKGDNSAIVLPPPQDDSVKSSGSDSDEEETTIVSDEGVTAADFQTEYRESLFIPLPNLDAEDEKQDFSLEDLKRSFAAKSTRSSSFSPGMRTSSAVSVPRTSQSARESLRNKQRRSESVSFDMNAPMQSMLFTSHRML